ncbi:BrnT family toxin [Caulobacter soli]|uniref:BrnT family toxin n=1 Tax=Caulobacter soli TaxID=2708539 RepID=UPI0013ED7474|nr:BrnT family toxin [Caulobacter soli]
MELEWDEEKRALTLANRGLDFAHADTLFDELTLTVEDDRFDYGETRFQTIGRIGHKTVLVVWTPRGEARRIISMRECNVRERERYESAVG